MCGQIGIFGDITKSQEAMFRDLWQIDVIRGDDSSGVAFINHQNHVRVLRAIGTPYEVMYTKAYEKANRKHHLCVIGHNRFATIGDVTEEMAHPHHEGDIIGTHNGTLINRHKLPDKGKFTSDSRQLFAAINKQGIEETWKNVDGAAAIVWWDRNLRTLNMLKNDERSLYFAYVDGDKEGSTVVWASEAWMIEIIAKRRNITVGTIWRPQLDTLYSFFFDKKTKIVRYRSKKLEKYVYKYKAPVNGYGEGKVWNRATFKWEEKKSIPFSLGKEDYSSSITLKEKNMSEERFKREYQTCAYCDGDLGEAGYVTSVIIDTNLAICEDCVDLSKACQMPYSGEST